MSLASEAARCRVGTITEMYGVSDTISCGCSCGGDFGPRLSSDADERCPDDGPKDAYLSGANDYLVAGYAGQEGYGQRSRSYRGQIGSCSFGLFEHACQEPA